MTAPRYRPQLFTAGGALLQATVRLDAPERCAVRWGTRLPERPAHPRLPELGAEGEELLPEGVILAALGLETDHVGWQTVVADLRSATAALHAAGMAHGAIAGGTIWIDLQGRAWLLGTGLGPGSPETDSTELQALAPLPVATLPSLHPDPAGRSSLVHRVQVLLQATEAADEPDDITHSRTHTGNEAFDEVAATLGPERGGGLFDDLRGETSWAEYTEPAEPTGPIADAARAVHRQLDVLVRLADDPPPALSPDALSKVPDEARALFRRTLALAQPANLLLPDVATPPRLPHQPTLGVLEEVTAALEVPAGRRLEGETTLPRPNPAAPAAPEATDPALLRARLVLFLGLALVALSALLLLANLLGLVAR